MEEATNLKNKIIFYKQEKKIIIFSLDKIPNVRHARQVTKIDYAQVSGDEE